MTKKEKQKRLNALVLRGIYLKKKQLHVRLQARRARSQTRLKQLYEKMQFVLFEICSNSFDLSVLQRTPTFKPGGQYAKKSQIIHESGNEIIIMPKGPGKSFQFATTLKLHHEQINRNATRSYR